MTTETATGIVEYSKTEAGLATLRQKYASAVFDVTTTAGLTSAREARAELRTLRVDLEKMRGDLKAPLLERGKLIDSEAKRITAELTALETPIDAQIKAEEARKEAERIRKAEAERQRVTAIVQLIDAMRRQPMLVIGQTSAMVRNALANFSDAAPTREMFAEFLDDATKAYSETVAALTDYATKREAEEAEAAKIAEERAALKREREEAAERERLAKEARIAEEAALRKLREDRDNSQRLADEKARQDREAEERRIAEERAQLERERAEFDARQQALIPPLRAMLPDDAVPFAPAAEPVYVALDFARIVDEPKPGPVAPAKPEPSDPALIASLTRSPREALEAIANIADDEDTTDAAARQTMGELARAALTKMDAKTTAKGKRNAATAA